MENKTVEKLKICQSCGMPMRPDQYGTGADGSPQEKYCLYCYSDGHFPSECTMEEMADFCAKFDTLEDGSSLICTVQMYGAMFLIKPHEYRNRYYLVAKEKPLPGTEAFTYEYFSALRKNLSGTLSMKAFLTTEQRIPGLGNGVLQDILLHAGMHPKRKMSTLREADWKRLYEAIVSVLDQMIQLGGRDTEKNLFGESGGYRTRLSKKTVGGPCPYCGNTIQKLAYLGGTVYYCPGCQEG